MKRISFLPIVEKSEKLIPSSFNESLFLRKVAVGAINCYQQYISPYKGFRCAYAHVYQGASCSDYGKIVVEEHGLVKGLQLLHERLHQCREAMLIIRNNGIPALYNDCDTAGDVVQTAADAARLGSDIGRLEQDCENC